MFHSGAKSAFIMVKNELNATRLKYEMRTNVLDTYTSHVVKQNLYTQEIVVTRAINYAASIFCNIKYL